MSLFGEIKSVKVRKTGNYFQEGLYKVRIEEVKVQKAAVGVKEFFIIETEVIESNNSDIPVGSEKSQVIDLTNAMAMNNVKLFMAAVSGVDPYCETVNEDVEAYWQGILGSYVSFDGLCDLVIKSANPLKDMELGLECVGVSTKKEKERAEAENRSPKLNFTTHKWIPRVL